MNDLISIIIPVYNVDKNDFINCINSIINQTYQNIEILIIDDGSKIDTKKLCDEYEKIDSRIKVYHKNNSGVSSTRNFGLNVSHGKYICFIDSDDLCDVEMINILYKNIRENNSDISVCGYKYIELDGKEYLKYGSSKKVNYSRKDSIISFFNDEIGVGVWNKLFDRDLIKNIKFDEKIKINEDKMFLFDAIMKSNRMVYEDVCLYNYIKRNNSATTKKFSENRFDVLIVNEYIAEIIQKEYPKDELILLKQHKNEIMYLIRLVRELKLSRQEKKYNEYYLKIKDRLKSISTPDVLDDMNKFEKIECKIFTNYEILYYPIFKIASSMSILKKTKNFFQRKKQN